MLRLYLDETRRNLSEQEDNVVAVGGYLAAPRQWHRFEAEWDSALKEARVTAFHATDFFNSRGEFEGWGNDPKKHRRFAKRFTAIAEKQTEVGVGRGVEEIAFEETVAAELSARCWTPHNRFTALMFCARMCIEWIAADYVEPHLPNEQVTVFLEAGPGVGEVIDYLTGLRDKGVLWLQRFTSFATGDKTLLPLQGADLVVHETGRRVQEVLEPSGRPVRKSLLRLTKTERLEIRTWTRNRLIESMPSLIKMADQERATFYP